MPRMLDLGNVLKLVNNCFNNRTFSGEQLISQAHQLILHVAFRLGEEGDVKVLKQLTCQLFRDVASVCKDFTKALFKQIANRLAVISITRCHSKVEQLTMLVDDEMQLEAKEPIHRSFTSGCQSSEHAVS